MANCTYDFCRIYPHLFNETTESSLRGNVHEIDQWVFMSSPYPIVALLVAYLYFVLKLGPDYMSTQKPFEIRNIMMGYNLFQVLYNLRIFVKFFLVEGAIWYVLNHTCHPIPQDINPLKHEFYANSWYYLVSKLTDLLDTVFFVVRKKQSHVTFLHVYHHTIMVVSTWIFLKYVRGEQVVAVGLVNSFVHVCMYSYYFLAALGPSVQRYLWWKPYITRLQLAQFIFIVTFLLSLLVRDCEVPKFFTTYTMLNGFVFLYLFSKFYINAYIRKKQD
ncbi:elongation of very long chain fatty acids protein AAEL008004-like [Macrosteles quadrilineatus]|uniref:elongation of very long chain fatty acids protein AAEL008004-like n=1 Tax=Macrosteles quadrilineatus TaxID=74068 RepID=UPI0023E21976|nr:elongation of very long chain fatty acids protein AAEL008004-like [Macrosteles quadrilineatus]XP_054286480.1 elongation of very long chain fatty acids protein AAEL008004-like [Macrosteles quadrilineatus]